MIKILIVFLFIFLSVLLGFRYIVVPRVIKNHTEFVDFNNIQFPQSPNFYYSPAKNSVFDVSISTLKKHWDTVIEAQPRVTELMTIPNGDQRAYVQLSSFWHFPDFIDVKFIAINPNRSSITVYSRSQFGYSDLGVNKKRVESWLLFLKNAVSK